MIARLWHGMTNAEDSDEYLEFLHKSGIPDYRATPGNKGVSVLRRSEGNKIHFLLISYWDSYEAIKAFAGDEIENARYYPDDYRWLLEFEPHVTHYDVADEIKG
jgi:heme-degrading monooxygenase HmoA